jgi:hypothetical protein
MQNMWKIIKKNLIAIFTLTVLVFGSNLSFGQENTVIASCCGGKSGRCTGSSYCSVCTNCSRCRHCNSGGSCGACSGGSIRTNNYNYPNSSKTKTSGSNIIKRKRYLTNNENSVDTSGFYYLPNDTYSEYYLKTLIVHIQTLNLRKGPSTNYGILEKLSKYQELVFLAMTGNWVKVRVKSTDSIGFVNYKYLSVLTE